MKSFAVLALAGLAAAQFNGLPTCAQSCANKFLTGGIGNCGTDPKCICSDKDFISQIACCLAQPGGCNAADQSSAITFASQLCAAQGVTVPAVVSCVSTATDATAATSTTAASASATTTSSSSSSSGTTATTSATGATAATTAATTATTTSSLSTGRAPRESAAVGAGLLGGVVAALALL